MKTFKSTYLANNWVLNTFPDDSLIYNALEKVGYEGFIPKTFITDLLIVSRFKLLNTTFVISNAYVQVLYDIIASTNIKRWIEDTIFLLKRIGDNYNLRTLEAYALSGESFKLESIKFSFNYIFDITEIDENVKQLLNITEDQTSEIIKLPEDIITILTIANGVGKFLKTSKTYTTTHQQMTKYGDITKIHKHVLADPLFKYKFSIKSYDIDKERVVTQNSNAIVLGYFISNYKNQTVIRILLKLLGSIILNNYVEGIKIIVYSFYMNVYSKKELTSIKEIIDYFSKDKQLKLQIINNSKALEAMITENPGSDIIYVPNILNNCNIKNNISSLCRVNMISTKDSRFNIQYSNICKQTNGTFLTI